MESFWQLFKISVWRSGNYLIWFLFNILFEKFLQDKWTLKLKKENLAFHMHKHTERGRHAGSSHLLARSPGALLSSKLGGRELEQVFPTGGGASPAAFPGCALFRI